jgi:hypothetical protein
MIIPLPGQSQAGRYLAVPFPRIAHRIPLLGLSKRPSTLGRFSLNILNLGDSPSPANSLNPYLHDMPHLMMVMLEA